MENTVKVLFENDTKPQWYIAMGNQPVGPMTASDVYERVQRGEISWAHFVWKAGQSEWKRLCDVKTFQAAVPAAPGKQIQKDVKSKSAPPTPPKGKGASRIWYLYYNDSQFGPFAADELNRFLNIGKIHGRVHAWKEGMDGWERLEKIGEFSGGVKAAQEVRAEKKSAKAAKGGGPAPLQKEGTTAVTGVKEQRRAPRRPLVARILMANEDSVIVGVCRDISVGGMQVLSDRVPGPTGSRVKLNISPSGQAGASSALKPFVAEGLIVRVLEDGRGFSFRFERLADDAKKAIESYIYSDDVGEPTRG